jgi:putative tryptophan/tyrosine transport system substrate-binding protein
MAGEIGGAPSRPKRLELLRALVPLAATIAFLVNPANSTTDSAITDMKAAAGSVGQQIVVVGASTVDEIDTAFARIARQGAAALLVNNDAFFLTRGDQIVALAARYRIPTTYFARDFTEAGGLMSYSDDHFESGRQAAIYVGRILKGEKLGDLPVLQPVKFELVINLKTAKTLGLTIPETLLATADEVIQ